AVRSCVRTECPRLKRELLCRKGLAHPRQRICRIGSNRGLLRGLRPSRRDDRWGGTSETSYKHQHEASFQGPLKEHIAVHLPKLSYRTRRQALIPPALLLPTTDRPYRRRIFPSQPNFFRFMADHEEVALAQI